jgi:nucleoside-diphosphate-sugar epimerase
MFDRAKGIRSVAKGLENCQVALLPFAPIDAVIHLAWDGVGSKGRADAMIQEVNYRNSMNLVTTAAKVGCRVFIGGGSQAEYGIVSGIINEDCACNPVSEYGKAKLRFTLDGSMFCREMGIGLRMARIFSVYGPGDHPWALIPSLLRALAAKKGMALTDCGQFWNYLFVEDAVRAVEALLTPSCADGIYNVASEVSRPLKEFVLDVCAFFPDSPAPLFGALANGSDSPVSLRPTVQKLQRNTGWRETTIFSEGIAKTVSSINSSNESER